MCDDALLQMERQMSMGSNMMGMQGPTHSSSCSATHIPSMHSEAKLVSSSVHLMHVHTHTARAGARETERRARSQGLRRVATPLFFHWAVPARLLSLGLCGFHHLVCNQSCV